MTKRSLAVAVLALAAPAVARAQAPPEFNAMCGDIACRVERVPAKWQLLSVGPELPFLKIVYESGGCLRGNEHVTIAETRSRVEVAVDQEKIVAIDTPDGLVACTREIRYRRFNVLLEHPIAGRRIVGGPRIRGPGVVYDRTKTVGGRLVPLVPRVGDLSVADATALLRFQGFKVRHLGRDTGRVAFQSPLPGKPAAGNAVRLTIGFGAFNGPKLKRCLESAGVPTTIRRPRPGDEDAPDLDLWLGRGKDFIGFVALYADPLRARENAPTVRRNARRLHGSVERRGRITIVWVKPPSAEHRAAVHGCLRGARP